MRTGTADPAPINTRSPGTMTAASTLHHLPSRLTVASGFNDFFKAATASPAFVVSYLDVVRLEYQESDNRGEHKSEALTRVQP